MDKKISEKLPAQVKKAKKPRAKSTEVETYVDKSLEYVGFGKKSRYNNEPIELTTGFGDVPYELTYENGIDISSVSKKITEAAAYKAILKNKRFQSTIDNMVRQLAEQLVDETVGARKQIEADRIADEKYAKQQAERLAKLAEEKKLKEEALKKEKAQKLIFMEGLNLTANQKKAFKKFYKVDIDKV